MDLRERARPFRWILLILLAALLAAAVGEAILLRGQMEEIQDRNAARAARCDPVTGTCRPVELSLNTSPTNVSFKEPSVKSDP